MTVTVRILQGPARARLVAAALVFAMGTALGSTPRALGASCTGAHTITLDRGSVTPTSGTTATQFKFVVRYRDTGNCVPQAVNVRMPDVGTFPMQQGAGRTFRQGVVYSVTVTLPAGRWTYWFAASSGTGAGERTKTLKMARPVTVGAESTPPPVTPTSSPPPSASTPPTRPSPSGGPKPVASGVPAPGPDRPGPGGSGFGFQIPAVFAGPMGGVVGPWMVLTAVGMTIFWVLVRRRPEARHAADGLTAVTAGGASAGQSRGGDDAGLPRWLRPSLQAARNAGWGVPPPRAPVRFRDPAAPGVDRREIGYRLVRVADGPDDLNSEEIGRLDRGDQVEVLETKGPFLRVRSADGLEGWVQHAAVVSILDQLD